MCFHITRGYANKIDRILERWWKLDPEAADTRSEEFRSQSQPAFRTPMKNHLRSSEGPLKNQ